MFMSEKIVGGFKGVYLGLRYGVWNDPEDYTLNFALEYDLILTNTQFKTREQH